MKKNPFVILGVCLPLLAGCGASPVPRFYVLAALPAPPAVDAGAEAEVGVGPLELPDYLDRPQIVTRSGQNELRLAEFDRWGEALKDNAAEVLAENLSVLLPSKKVSVYPWKRSEGVRYQVAVKIVRFDRAESGETVLQARWRILDANGAELLARQSRYAETASGEDYAATVAAMNRALAQFSRELANAVNGLKSGG
jgi:hypothetical protein